MNNPTVFQGTFSDFRIVKGRKVVQIMVEVPSEQANAALAALGGLPDPANPAWVAVARLDAKHGETPKQIEPPKERKRWEDMPPAQQSAIRCGEESFREFLAECRQPTGAAWRGAPDAEAAAACVRLICGVNSRSELNTDPTAATAWRHLDNEYWLWSRGYQQ